MLARALAAAVLAGLAVSLTPPGVAWWTDSELPPDLAVRAASWTMGALLVAAAVGPIARRGRRAWVAGALSAAVALALAEVGVRIAIAAGAPSLRNPARYADPYRDESYWRLLHAWHPAAEEFRGGIDFHPALGWAPPETDEDPLGSVLVRPRSLDPAAPNVLFFGDSFVHGTTPVRKRIPHRLELELRGPPVWNLGVVGYGLGQIRARMDLVAPRFERPVCVAGLFSRDLDRTLLGVRAGPKPWWRAADGALVAGGLPIDPPDPVAWIAAHPARVRSFALAALVRAGLDFTGGRDRAESRWDRARRLETAGLLLDDWARDARESDRALLFVLFVPRRQIEEEPGWRETFLRERLDALGVPWVDTAPLIARAAGERGVRPRWYYGRDGHLNGEGNALVAAEVARLVRDLWPDRLARR